MFFCSQCCVAGPEHEVSFLSKEKKDPKHRISASSNQETFKAEWAKGAPMEAFIDTSKKPAEQYQAFHSSISQSKAGAGAEDAQASLHDVNSSLFQKVDKGAGI